LKGNMSDSTADLSVSSAQSTAVGGGGGEGETETAEGAPAAGDQVGDSGVQQGSNDIPDFQQIPVIADADITKALPARFTGVDADLAAAEAAFDVVQNTSTDIGL